MCKFQVGSVRIMDVTAVTENESISPNSIDAHLSEVAELAVNNQGTLLATGSIKGTVIRLNLEIFIEKVEKISKFTTKNYVREI